ncbi:hypothetical protein IQ62_09310 [Streptomyces scabiei]|nr:hypothetical protein IQ62_09310 [Streptomyces scabiei]
MHTEDAVGFTTARRFAPNRPYRVTFNGGVHGLGDNAYCQAPPYPRLTSGSSEPGTEFTRPIGREGPPPAAAGRSKRGLSRGQAREMTTDLVLVYACSASGPDSRP